MVEKIKVMVASGYLSALMLSEDSALIDKNEVITAVRAFKLSDEVYAAREQARNSIDVPF